MILTATGPFKPGLKLILNGHVLDAFGKAVVLKHVVNVKWLRGDRRCQTYGQ